MLYEERRPRTELRPYLDCLWLVSDPGRSTRRTPDLALHARIEGPQAGQTVGEEWVWTKAR